LQTLGALPKQEWDSDLKIITAPYELKNGTEVFKYLRDHRFLDSVLRKAPHKIGEHFPHAAIGLQVITDPEIEGDEAAHLGIFIYTDLDPDEAVDRLDALDDDWWLDASRSVDGKLGVHLDFV